MSLWGQGNMGKHCRQKGNIPLPHTHYGVRNRSHRLGGPEAWPGGLGFFLYAEWFSPPMCPPSIFHPSISYKRKKLQNERSASAGSWNRIKRYGLDLPATWGWELFQYQLDHPQTSKQVHLGGLKYDRWEGGGSRLAAIGGAEGIFKGINARFLYSKTTTSILYASYFELYNKVWKVNVWSSHWLVLSRGISMSKPNY